jgi:DNA-binding phage protein
MSRVRRCTRASVACAAAAMSMLAAAADLAPGEDIRDIRGPKGILPVWLLPALLAGMALLALLAYAVWRWKRRQNLPRPLLPFEITLQRLEDIRRLMNPSSVREFSIAISDIVRQYIEDVLKVTATHRTTEEFLHDLLESSNESLVLHRGLLAEFLNYCDMAKFAGMSLSTQIMQSLHHSARSFVIATSRPVQSGSLEAHDQLPAT